LAAQKSAVPAPKAGGSAGLKGAAAVLRSVAAWS
jgi:hypothetical protein